MDSRRAGAALVAAAVLAGGCGAGSSSSRTDRCLRHAAGVEAIVTTFGDQRFVRFSDGSLVGIAEQRDRERAALLAPAAAGPGDPYAYKAVGRFVVAWRGDPDDPHLAAVERCLAQP